MDKSQIQFKEPETGKQCLVRVSLVLSTAAILIFGCYEGLMQINDKIHPCVIYSGVYNHSANLKLWDGVEIPIPGRTGADCLERK